MDKKSVGPTTNLFPMPTLLIAVKTGENSSNILTVAWAGIISGEPPMMALDISSNHYSSPFIEKEGNFSVNIPRSNQAVQADYCGIVSGSQDKNKAKTCGWTLSPCQYISAPMIAECPLNFECRVVRRVEVGSSSFIIAEILQTHVDSTIVDEKGNISASDLDPLIYVPGGQYYKLGENVAKAFSVGKKLKK